jgi:mRNA-degrading endonuclease toxin of MazEF toxin-antitoxin module
MNAWKRGDIVVVAFPYTEPDGRIAVKGRPALVISGNWINENTEDIIIAAINSRIPSRIYPTDFRIEKGTSTFQNSGLRVTSTVKAAVLGTIPQTVVARKLDRLTIEDLLGADDCLRAAIGL